MGSHLLGGRPAAAWTLGSWGDCLLSCTGALLQGCCLLLHALQCRAKAVANAGKRPCQIGSPAADAAECVAAPCYIVYYVSTAC